MGIFQHDRVSLIRMHMRCITHGSIIQINFSRVNRIHSDFGNFLMFFYRFD